MEVKMFVDRCEAGERLAEVLLGFASEDPVVLGLPRGGVPVAAEVASALRAPLDVLVVRKLGCPWQPELGVGAIGEGGVRVVNAPLIEMLNISQAQLDQIVAREESEVARRVHRYRGDRLPVGVEGRTVIIVDDGLATGFTARAGIEVVRHLGARRVVLAVPVAPRETLEQLRASPMRRSRWRRRIFSSESGSSTSTSPRRPTRRSPTSWPMGRPHPARRSRRILRSTSTWSSARSTFRAPWPGRSIRRERWCSRTAAAVAG
jgi:predicted phosphoribosyltransferase